MLEIRILVKPDKISDDQMTILARDIAKRIEDEMDYPGQIKVNVIRETRVADYAKQIVLNKILNVIKIESCSVKATAFLSYRKLHFL